VINLLNTAPPYDPGFSSTFLYDYSMYDVRGRQFRMNFNYKM
jgi:iron complex outermembrane receptor protein